MNQYQQPFQQPAGYRPMQNYYEQLRHKKPIKRWGMIIGLGLLLNIAIQMCLGGIWTQVSMSLYHYGLGEGLLSLIDESANLIIYVASLWPATLFIVGRIKIPAELAFPIKNPRLSITVPGLFVCLGASMAGWLITTALSWGLEFVFGLYPVTPDFGQPTGLAANIVSVISITLIPAVFEELLFRGAIMQSLRRFGDGFALVASAILFGLMHGNFTQGVTATMMGLLFGYFVLRTGSILPAMIIHFVNNALSTVFTYAGDYMSNAQVQIMNTAIFAGYVLLGAVGLIILLLRFSGMFRVAPSPYPLSGGKKLAAFFLTPAQIIFILIMLLFTAFSFTLAW
jgi:membrane protease YdiL (CAAX protease family)